MLSICSAKQNHLFFFKLYLQWVKEGWNLVGSDPLNLFLDTCNFFSEVNDAISFGKVPCRLFWSSFKVCNFVQFANCKGMVPVNEFPSNKRVSKLVSCPNSDGISPENSLLVRIKFLRFMEPNSVGIVPVNWKFSKSIDSEGGEVNQGQLNFFLICLFHFYSPKLLSKAISVGTLPRGIRDALAECIYLKTMRQFDVQVAKHNLHGKTYQNQYL